MRKILYFITQAEFGGAQRYVFDLAYNLKADFQVAVAFGQNKNNGKLAKILQKNNIEYFIVRHLKRAISPISDILAIIEITKLIKRHKPDIIHLNSSKISILGSIAGFITGTKTVYTAHGWVFNEPMPGWKKTFYRLSEKFTAKLKYKIICVSEYDRQTALKHKIAPAGKLTVIHNGITFRHSGTACPAGRLACPAGRLDPESSIQKLEQISGSRIMSEMTNNILIGSIGNLYETKGFEYFIQAAGILINRNKINAKFLIIGEGSARKNLENSIKKHNLENNFILAGQIDQAAKLLKAFDIYVCSSVKEGWPYSIMEAMNAGLPIISTNTGGIPEMMQDKKTGLLAKPADAEDLAEKIKFLADDKNLRTELGENAKQAAKQNFDLKKMIKETKKIYYSSLSSV